MASRNDVTVRFLGDASALNTVLGRVDTRLSGLERLALRSATAIAVATGAVVTQSVTAFASFEEAATNAAATFSLGEEITTEKMASIEEAARRVGKTSTLSATEGAEALDQLALAGFNVEQALSSLDVVSFFAEANKLDLGAATDFLTDIQTGFRLKSDDIQESTDALQRISDVTTRAASLGTQSNEQTAAGMAAVAGSAGALNQSLEGTAAILSFFADNSKKGVEGASQLDIMLRSLTAKASKNKEAFAEQGISVFDSNGEIRDMIDILGDFDTAFAGASGQEFVDGLAKLGVTEKTNQGLFKFLGASDELIERYDKLLDAGGSTESKRAIQLQSLNAQWAIFKGKVEDVAISIGSTVAPMILNAMNRISDWWDQNGERVTEGIKRGLGRIGEWWNTTGQGLFDTLKTALGKVWEVAKKLFFGVSDWWDTHGDGVITFLKDFKTAVEEAFNVLSDWWDENGDDVTNGFKTIADWLGKVIRKLGEWKVVSTTAKIIATAFTLAIDIVAEAIRIASSTIAWIIRQLIRLGTWIGKAILWVGDKMAVAFDILSEAIVLVIDGAILLGEKLGGAILWIKDEAIKTKDDVVRGFNVLVGFMRGLPGRVSRAVSGMWGGVKDGFKSALNSVIRLWNDLEFTTPSFSLFGKNTPSITIRTPNIPELASGGVTGVNDPFLAVVGDNKTQREIITPEGLMRDIVREEVGGSGSAIGNLTINMGNAVSPKDVVDEIHWQWKGAMA